MSLVMKCPKISPKLKNRETSKASSPFSMSIEEGNEVVTLVSNTPGIETQQLIFQHSFEQSYLLVKWSGDGANEIKGIFMFEIDL